MPVTNTQQEKIVTKPGPGKFEANESLELATYLYDMCGIQAFDDEFGDNSSGLGWYALFTNITPGDEVVGDPLPHHYIVEEDIAGFFTYREFDNPETASKEFQRLMSERDVEHEIV
jgi:hypothetical protein